MWKAKEKQIGVEQINGHVPRRNPLITGRAPENTEMLFTPAELFGAMAQCSSKAKMDQRAARAQVQMCRHLIARHVDDKNEHFALLETARTLKDYVGKTMTGLVGDGIAYRQQQRWEGKQLIVVETQLTKADDRALALENGFGLAWPPGKGDFKILWPPGSKSADGC